MPSTLLTEAFPVLRAMTQRQLELLHLKGIRLPDSEFRVVDLSQNLMFSQVAKDKVPCVTPDGQKFLTQRVRFLTGIESLRLMGIYLDESKLRQGFSASFLQDLAGNAYETSSCAANFMCNLIFLAHNSMCKNHASRLPKTPSLAASKDAACANGDDDSGIEVDLASMFF